MSANRNGNSGIGEDQKLSPPVCIEPVQIPIEGILPARALSRVEQPEHSMTSRDVHSPTRRFRSCACVMLANFSDETLTVPKATVLGIAEGISESLVDKINVRSEAKLNEPAKPPRKRKNEILYNKLLHGKLDHLSSAEREHIKPVLRKYAHVFHDEDSNDFKGTTVIEHEIPIGDARPIRRPPIQNPVRCERRNGTTGREDVQERDHPS